VQDAEKENNCYEQYQKLGGIINEKDYESALARAKNTTVPDLDIRRIKQSELMAKIAVIELRNTKDAMDQRTVLYVILRADTAPKGIKYHHNQMSDQHLFAEALRMLEDIDSLNKLINTHPNISFAWK